MAVAGKDTKLHHAASLCEEEFAKVFSQKSKEFAGKKRNASTLGKFKVIAGVVLEWKGKMEVVALGAGHKNVVKENLTKDGSVVVDSHAEVVARRSLIRYLYNQLELCAQGKERKSILDCKPPSGRYKVKDGVSFHMYISTPPCGDARVFGVSERDRHPERSSRGKARGKIDCGDGSV